MAGRESSQLERVTGLHVSIGLHGRTATLRGTVAGPEDADAAETVVARVPGVLDIVDLLDVVAFNARSGRSPR